MTPGEGADAAMPALDDSVAGVLFPVTPIFDELVERLDGDPRGVRVPTWEEVGYAGGRRGRRDEPDAGAGR